MLLLFWHVQVLELSSSGCGSVLVGPMQVSELEAAKCIVCVQCCLLCVFETQKKTVFSDKAIVEPEIEIHFRLIANPQQTKTSATIGKVLTQQEKTVFYSVSDTWKKETCRVDMTLSN